MVKIDPNAFQEDLRRLGLIMPAAGLIGYFIEPVSPASLAASMIGGVAWLAAAPQAPGPARQPANILRRLQQ